MEYVNGPSCADLLREQKRLTSSRPVRIVRGACHGLDYAHRAGVVHRDVKPGNLLVSRRVRHAEAGRLRDREGGRADAASPRSARCSARPPTSRPSRRRARRPGRLRHLLARRVRLPVPHRPAAARVQLAHRARPQAAARGGRADHRAPPRGAARARPRDPRGLEREPGAPLRLRARRWPRAIDAGAPRRGAPPHRGVRHAPARRCSARPTTRPRRYRADPRAAAGRTRRGRRRPPPRPRGATASGRRRRRSRAPRAPGSSRWR